MIRVMFFEEDAATEVAAQLARDGFAADVRREPFAGEDDDEDHPWVVVTDAPPVMVELLADGHDGWVEYDEAPDPRHAPSPLQLPGMPKRLHRDPGEGAP